MPLHQETHHPVVNLLLTGHFREGKGYTNWRENGTSDWLLIATLDGVGRFGYGSGTKTVEAGDLILLRPGTCHDYGIAPGNPCWELLWTHFHPHPHWHEWLEWPEIAPGLMHIRLEEQADREEIFARFFAAHSIATGAQSQREAFAMNRLEEVLLLCDQHNPRLHQSRLDRRVAIAMEILCQNLGEHLSIEELANQCGLSVSRLAHLFRQQVGLTPVQYLEQQRMDRACQLLVRTNRPVHVIASELGFESPFYFTTRFRRHTGKNPRAYRQQFTSDSQAS